MHKKSENLPLDQRRRLEIEYAIAGYPKIEDHELEQVLLYLKKEASAMDRALIASNEAIRLQYRSLCHDHYLDRLHPTEMVLLTIFSGALISVVVWLSFQ